MSIPENCVCGAGVAEEAHRYLAVVDLFATLGADPHRDARARAACARTREDRATTTTARKAVSRWRS